MVKPVLLWAANHPNPKLYLNRRRPYAVYLYSKAAISMISPVLDRQPLRLNLDEDQIEAISWLMDHLPLSFTGAPCAPARELLGWNVDALASASGVSPHAIHQLERGGRLKPVSMQALAFALEAEGLVFFPGHPPLTGENCRGATKDPRDRRDYHLLE